MRPNEFIKENGIEKAIELYNSNDWSTVSEIFLHDLKRLIGSHDLLDEIDGIDGAQDRIYICEIDDCTSFSLGGYVYEISRIKQAIADVESCQ